MRSGFTVKPGTQIFAVLICGSGLYFKITASATCPVFRDNVLQFRGYLNVLSQRLRLKVAVDCWVQSHFDLSGNLEVRRLGLLHILPVDLQETN